MELAGTGTSKLKRVAKSPRGSTAPHYSKTSAVGVLPPVSTEKIGIDSMGTLLVVTTPMYTNGTDIDAAVT